MNGIANVIANDWLNGIVAIIALISRSGNPDYVVASLCADCIDNRLKIVERCARCYLFARSVSLIDFYRLVGKLNHDRRVTFLYKTLGNIFPHLYKVFLIVVAYGNLLGTHARRTHNDVYSVCLAILCHLVENRVEILLEAKHVESRDIALVTIICAWIVAPIRVHVQAKHVNLVALVENSRNHSFVIVQTAVNIVVIPILALLVKPRAVGLRHAMKIYLVAVFINKISAFDVQFGHRHIAPRLGSHNRHTCHE